MTYNIGPEPDDAFIVFNRSIQSTLKLTERHESTQKTDEQIDLIFSSKMSEEGINFLKTKKRGRVGYKVRQRVNDYASKKGVVTQRLTKTQEAVQRLPYSLSPPAAREPHSFGSR